MGKTLLEKAKEVPVRKKHDLKITDEHIEIAFAWIKGDIRLKQICIAFGKKESSGNVLYTIAVILREAYQQGKLKLKP